MNWKLCLVGIGGWGMGVHLSLFSMWPVAGLFLWQYMFTLFPFFLLFINGIGLDLSRPTTGEAGCLSVSLAPWRPMFINGWLGQGLWLPYSGHNHMSVSRVVAISWQGNQPVASAWIRLPWWAGHQPITQMGRIAVAFGGRIQDTCISFPALLLLGCSLAAAVGRTCCLYWQLACRSRNLSPSPTGPWWTSPPSAWNQHMSPAIFWLFQTWPAWPFRSSLKELFFVS